MTEAAVNAGTGDVTSPTENWWPEEDTDYVTSKGWNNPDGVMGAYKSYRALERHQSELNAMPQNFVRIPKDFENPEEVAAFRKSLGVPDDVSGYGIEIPENDPILEHILNTALETGVPKDSMGKFVSAWQEKAAQIHEQSVAAAETQSMSELEEWKQEQGQALEKSTQYGKEAYRAFPMLAEFCTQIEEAMGTKNFMPFITSLGKAISEHGSLGVGDSDVMTRGDAQQKLAEFKLDLHKMNAACDDSDPNHKAMQAELMRLVKAAG